LSARFSNLNQILFEAADAIPNTSAIYLQFSFPRPSTAYSPCQARHGCIFCHQPWQQIMQLSQLDLKLAFAAVCTLSKNIQNQLSAIDYL